MSEKILLVPSRSGRNLGKKCSRMVSFDNVETISSQFNLINRTDLFKRRKDRYLDRNFTDFLWIFTGKPVILCGGCDRHLLNYLVKRIRCIECADTTPENPILIECNESAAGCF